jgi:hypothetical protein
MWVTLADDTVQWRVNAGVLEGVGVGVYLRSDTRTKFVGSYEGANIHSVCIS